MKEIYIIYQKEGENLYPIFRDKKEEGRYWLGGSPSKVELLIFTNRKKAKEELLKVKKARKNKNTYHYQFERETIKLYKCTFLPTCEIN